jgi:(4S)-4-hydroxy-5-phosphonooxypentane-2,3-dione isomerase
MAPRAILVEFTVKSDAVGRFRELITTNATRSLADEPGCRRFDVLSPAGEPARIVLYEIYDDDRAFERHLATPHYKDFAAAAEPLIETRSIKRLEFVSPAVTR